MHLTSVFVTKSNDLSAWRSVTTVALQDVKISLFILEQCSGEFIFWILRYETITCCETMIFMKEN